MGTEMRTYSRDMDLVKERREHIRKCTTSLFVKKPFHKTNMREVEEACGMSRGALYNYVGSKEDIRTLIIEHALSLGGEAVITSGNRLLNQFTPTEALKEMIKRMFENFDRLQDEYIFINHEVKNLSKEARKALFSGEGGSISAVEGILQAGIDSGEFQIDDIKLVAHTILISAHAWATRRWYLRKLYTIDEYTRNFTELIMKLVVAAKA